MIQLSYGTFRTAHVYVPLSDTPTVCTLQSGAMMPQFADVVSLLSSWDTEWFRKLGGHVVGIHNTRMCSSLHLVTVRP